MRHAIITFVYSMYLFTNKPWKIVLDGCATLLVGNRYNRTFVLMNLVLCAHNTTGHNIVQPTTVSDNQYVEPTAINILIDIFQKCFFCIPYSGKFSRGPIFAEGQSSKISRSNIRGWPFQNFSAHNTWLTPPLTACPRGLEKLVRTNFLA